MRRNSVTPLASPEPTKKPRINSFEEHVASASAALPSCLSPEVPTQLPGQVRQPLPPRAQSRVPCVARVRVGRSARRWLWLWPQTQACVRAGGGGTGRGDSPPEAGDSPGGLRQAFQRGPRPRADSGRAEEAAQRPRRSHVRGSVLPNPSRTRPLVQKSRRRPGPGAALWPRTSFLSQAHAQYFTSSLAMAPTVVGGAPAACPRPEPVRPGDNPGSQGWMAWQWSLSHTARGEKTKRQKTS